MNTGAGRFFERKYLSRRYDKNTAEIARHFYHDKFALQTCILIAHSHFVANVYKKSIAIFINRS